MQSLGSETSLHQWSYFLSAPMGYGYGLLKNKKKKKAERKKVLVWGYNFGFLKNYIGFRFL